MNTYKLTLADASATIVTILSTHFILENSGGVTFWNHDAGLLKDTLVIAFAPGTWHMLERMKADEPNASITPQEK